VGPAVPTAGRKVPCEQCPLREQPVFRDFSTEELQFISGFKSGEMNVETGTNLLLQGTNSALLYTVLSGWAFRYKILPDGQRQILNYVLPGDFVGLQGSVADEMHHSVEALTDMLLCIFPRERLWELYSNHPTLAYDITWLAAREEQMLDEHLVNIGRRNALARIANLLLHLFVRAEEAGLTKGLSVQLPITQQHVADTLGMSLVHTNKTLKRLDQTKTVRWRNRRFEIVDRKCLAEIAGFEMPDPQRRRPFI